MLNAGRRRADARHTVGRCDGRAATEVDPGSEDRSMRWGGGRSQQGGRRGGEGAHPLLRGVAPATSLAMLILTVLALTLHSRQALLGATAGSLPSGSGALPLYLTAICVLLAAGVVIVLQSSRLATRVAGPELRLIRAMQRIRSGDLAFRVHLRKGDLLGGLARECNALLDWLNANPPAGAHTGTDLVDMHPTDSDAHELAEVHE